MAHCKHNKAFTLIELSIVLVIIGLIVGGVLVGRDLVAAAAVRAQVVQIEKYQTAVNTFRGKYNNYLPGDISEPTATQFGFAPRGQYPAQGDGNGILEGSWSNGNGFNRMVYRDGELGMFWKDLSTAGLIDERFTNASASSLGGATITDSTNPSVRSYMPQAKIGQKNFLFVYSVIQSINGWNSLGTNYFCLAPMEFLGANGDSPGNPTNLSLSVAQAFAIDTKTDDGLPQSGRVQANFPGGNIIQWASGTTASSVWGANDGSWGGGQATTAATAGSATTCYDNNNVAGPQKYSLTQNNGAGLNCALSIKFQ